MGRKMSDPEKVPEKNDQAEAAKAASALAQKALDEMNQLKGQMSVLAAAASAPFPETVQQTEAPDINLDTEKAMDHHFEKRAKW